MPQQTDPKPLIEAPAIAERVEVLAAEMAARLPRDVQIVAVLKGSFVFTADLIRALARAGVDWPMDFITLSSYGSDKASSGTVRVVRDIDTDLAGRDVLLIDDILESGRTLAFARDLFLARGARRVWLCTLLDKPMKRAVACDADFIGFTVADRFLVGYGLDWAHRYRGLPYIAAVD